MKSRRGQAFAGLWSDWWVILAVALLAIQAASASMIGAGASRSPYASIMFVPLLLALLLATGRSALSAIRSRQSIRLFWFFFSSSCMLLAINSWSWIYYVAVLHKDHPDYLFASVPLFLQPIFLIAAVASRPHVKLWHDKPYRTTSNFLQLLFFWVFAYAFVLFPVSYMQWDAALILRGGVLYAVESLLLLAVLGTAVFTAGQPWKGIYKHLFGASALYALGSLTAHLAIVAEAKSSGLENILYTAAGCWFAWVALRGRALAPQLAEKFQIDPINPRYTSTLALVAVMAIPIVGIWELLRADEVYSTRAIRLLIVLLAILFLAVAALLTEHFSRRDVSADVALAHQRLRMAMMSGKSMLWDRDLTTGRALWVGDLQRFFGIPSDTLSIGAEDFYRYVHPDDRGRVFAAFRNAQTHHRLYQAEFRTIRRDGTTVWATAAGEFFYGKNGTPERVLGVTLDITERKLAEQALRKSEEKFSKVFRESPMAVSISSTRDHRYLDVNEGFERITGWRRDEAIGRTPFDLQLWVDPADRLEVVRRVQSEGSLRNVRCLFRRRDGTQIVGLGSADLIEIDGEPCLISVIADISELEKAQEQLRENEQRLRAIVDSAMDGIIAVDEQQRIVLFNAAAEEIFCCTADDAIGSTIGRFIPPRFRSKHVEHMRRFGESGVTDRGLGKMAILWGVRSNGEEFPAEISISRSEAGGKKNFTAIIRDISERQSAEEALRASEQRLRLAFQAGRMYAYEWDASTNTTVRSHEFLDILGTDQPLWTSRSDLLTNVHPEDQDRLAAALAGITPENTTSVVQYRLVRPDGSEIWLEKRARAFFDEESRLQRIVGVIADITDRKLADAALKESEQRFRLVANTAPVMIWMAAPDKACNYVNQTWLEFTGRPLEAELGDGWTQGIHPEDKSECFNAYTSAFDRRETFKAQYRVRRHDGEYRWVLDMGVPRFGPDGSFAGYIGSCVDITSLKLAEEALTNVGRRLIEAHEEERSRIARELHDDINQQIALLAIELDRCNQRIPESATDLRDLIHHARQRLSDIGTDIQALSHRLHSSKLDYLGIAKASSSFCTEFSEQQKVKIEFIHSDLPHAVPKEVALCLFRVLQEALQNAVKHSGARRFNVQLRGSPSEIHLTVSDLGIGFDPQDAANRRGLGLVSMRERLQLVGGRLSIRSAAGRGTTIEAYVPLDPGK